MILTRTKGFEAAILPKKRPFGKNALNFTLENPIINKNTCLFAILAEGGQKDESEMKKAEKVASVVIGIILFIIAAVFSVGLLIQLLDFGAGTPGQQGGLYRFGEMLVSVYGVSSIFITAFL